MGASSVLPCCVTAVANPRSRKQCLEMLQKLYGSTAAALYTQAADFNKTARFYYMKAEDTYYKANDAASYDDWKRARHQWDAMMHAHLIDVFLPSTINDAYGGAFKAVE